MANDSASVTENTKFKDGVNRNARLIVRNVPFKATEEQLKQHFTQFGTVEEVSLLRKPDGKLVGCAFVHFTHVPMANKALAATNKKIFLGRPLNVSWAVPKHKYNEEMEGESQTPREKNTDITPKDDSNATTKPLWKTDSQPSKSEKSKVRINPNARLIIRNVSFKATEETLREHFEPYGTIHDLKLLKKPDGKLIGCAFVHFKNFPMAKKALLNTNMKPFLGRPISVDWAVAKNKYMQHVVNQQLEMQEDVKKEDSDSDDDDAPPLNISTDEVKDEIKSESEESGKNDSNSENSDHSDDEEEDEEFDGKEEDEEEESEDEDTIQDKNGIDRDDTQSVTSTQTDRQRIKLNDAEDGCTVFITNIPFSIDDLQLQNFAERTGQVKYALICMDKMTEHSKGTGFVKFLNKDDADTFLSLPADQLRLDGQILQVKPALKKENVVKGNKKESKDNRNLYLVKEGVVVAGTKAAVGLSASDMAKRLALERSKTQMLKNLNRFVSRYRLVVSNLPANTTDSRLRTICVRAAGSRSTVTEARVMRDLRAPVGHDGKHPSKGYGFVMFTRHEDALACLRKLNNNPDIFDKNNRPIVSFSIEDRTALNARKKRLEKSIANNPLAKKSDENVDQNNRKNRKRKLHTQPDESYVKKGRFEKKNNRKNNFVEAGKFVRRPNDEEMGEFTGLTAKVGAQHKMRNNHKLKSQAELHRQNVKLEKKKSKRALRLKMAARERIKLPKQKINKIKRDKKFYHDD